MGIALARGFDALNTARFRECFEIVIDLALSAVPTFVFTRAT
jgi:hypothetical protein